MTDVFTKKKRSRIMASIQGKHTAPEKTAYRMLRTLGLKVRRHDKNLPGCPDIVLPEQKIAVFLNGCFWHGHKGCGRAKLPATNRKFWTKKISGNIKRDGWQQRLLKQKGWKVLVLWTCRKPSRERLIYRLRRFGVAAA